MSRGAFILMEGVDRAGKSTQAQMLQRFLTNQPHSLPTRIIQFPFRTTDCGKLIDSYLRLETPVDPRAIHLLFSANRWEKSSFIWDTLLGNTSIIADRYAHSGAAFSVAKGLDLKYCLAADSGLPAPDLVFFFDIDPEQACLRPGFGEEVFEKRDFQTRVRDVYFKHLIQPNWVVIDATQSIEQIHQIVADKTLALFSQGALPSIQTLNWL